jgi:hypothetical protein
MRNWHFLQVVLHGLELFCMVHVSENKAGIEDWPIHRTILYNHWWQVTHLDRGANSGPFA